jgi:hypothetical protein
MAYITGEFLKRLSTLGHVPFQHSKLPALGMVHLELAWLALLGRKTKGTHKDNENTVKQKTRFDFRHRFSHTTSEGLPSERAKS